MWLWMNRPSAGLSTCRRTDKCAVAIRSLRPLFSFVDLFQKPGDGRISGLVKSPKTKNGHAPIIDDLGWRAVALLLSLFRAIGIPGFLRQQVPQDGYALVSPLQ